MIYQHTPGPWTFKVRHHALHDSYCVEMPNGVIVITNHQDSSPKANCRLIAAAPELLEMLELAIRAMNNTPSFNTGIWDESRGRNVSSYDLLPRLEAIVRKATGKS